MTHDELIALALEQHPNLERTRTGSRVHVEGVQLAVVQYRVDGQLRPFVEVSDGTTATLRPVEHIVRRLLRSNA